MPSPSMPLLIARNRFEEERGFGRFMKGNQQHVKLLVDSGAYSYWRHGVPMSVDNYMRWLDTFPYVGDDYIQLDVIGDINQTRRNLDIMLRKGFKPWPVFQRGAPEPWLTELAQLGPVVCIGCGIGTPGYQQYAAYWAKKAHELEVPVHLLGVSQLGIIRRYVPFSCDSSGKFADAGRFGRLDMLDQNYFYGQKIKPKHQKMIRQMGFDPDILKRKEAWRVKKGGELSCYSQFIQYAVLTRLVTKLQETIGTTLYGVLAEYQAPIYLKQWRTYHERRKGLLPNQQGI